MASKLVVAALVSGFAEARSHSRAERHSKRDSVASRYESCDDASDCTSCLAAGDHCRWQPVDGGNCFDDMCLIQDVACYGGFYGPDGGRVECPDLTADGDFISLFYSAVEDGTSTEYVTDAIETTVSSLPIDGTPIEDGGDVVSSIVTTSNGDSVPSDGTST
eukprot:GHVH01016373.1.p1 GENE.GHVH01016373.1~~GHVH01016373.1.p1  ORF type:complete len:162 (+),score=25.91 GHVH01016373.1:990-1475(+)